MGSEKSARRRAQLQGDDHGAGEIGVRAAIRQIQTHLLHSHPARHRHLDALEYVHHGERLFCGLQAFGELHRPEQHRVRCQLYALCWLCVTNPERAVQLDEHLR